MGRTQSFMEDHMAHLQHQIDVLSDKLAILATLAEQTGEMLTTLMQKKHRILYVTTDRDGDFVCECEGKSIILLTAGDVIRVAEWCGFAVQCNDPSIAAELKETMLSMSRSGLRDVARNIFQTNEGNVL